MLEIIKKVYKEKKLSLLIIEKIIFIVYIFFNYINIANNSRILMVTKLNEIGMEVTDKVLPQLVNGANLFELILYIMFIVYAIVNIYYICKEDSYITLIQYVLFIIQLCILYISLYYLIDGYAMFNSYAASIRLLQITLTTFTLMIVIYLIKLKKKSSIRDKKVYK